MPTNAMESLSSLNLGIPPVKVMHNIAPKTKSESASRAGIFGPSLGSIPFEASSTL